MEDNLLPARVFLRPIGTPIPIGMAGLAIASLVQSGLELSWIAKDQKTQVGLILLAVPAILQFLACVLSYLARDGAAGTTFGVLATTWLAQGLVHISSRPGQVSGALGLLLLVAGGVLLLSAVVLAQVKLLPATTVAVTAVRFIVGGIYELSAISSWQDATGIIGLVVTGVAAYGVLAMELEGQARRTVLPTFRRGRGAEAVHAGPQAQISQVFNEAGVRETT